ncbi:flagellar filament capping protein FliD [Sporomusa sphaeroides DSM 2875]|uniref:flagellar filament capping protein FliD n=1 Tax=Sporomusa sphaeroides TaxID=47679 RepID=UPI00202F4B4E|nr:flagellar filament capping protein FliD [Sporomusa sphaeroides]MCM0760625.1 flagellar filament capping protein FliD [Sporomusa sphaeroides DSM 2875]
MASSSGSVTATTVNGTSRITGLSSGIDVDSIVEQLMAANKSKLNRLKQKEQLATWRQESYREIISNIQQFQSKYFDLTSSSSIISKKTFQAFAVTSSSTAVTASSTGSAAAGTHSVSVSQLATAASMTTSGRFSGDITGTSAADYTAAAGKSFAITLDGTKYTVTLDSDSTDIADVQAAVDAAVGTGKVTVTEDGGYLTMAAVEGSGVQKLTLSAPATGVSALGSLGLTAGQSNRISTALTLAELAESMATAFTFDDDQVEFSINGVSFSFDKDTTLSSMISTINQSDAGVTMAYDELTDQLTLTANSTGAGNMLNVSENGSTFLAEALGTTTAGTDARLTIDGVSLTRSSNTVTVEGVTYTLNQVTSGSDTATVTLTQDVDAIYNNISSFVTAYNELIATINTALSEKYDSDYPPLTEDQEAEMSESEIEKWNTKAKTGLLASDSTLKSMLTSIRSALMSSVADLNLSRIGITTGTYDEQGKLYINEDTLKEAIQSEPEAIANLFAQSSTTHSGTSTVRSLNAGQRSVRYSEEGLGYRIYDILSDYVSTLRDSSGNKGKLLEKAGIENDTTESDNSLSDQLTELKKRIEKEEDRLEALSERLYSQYTSLETYISTMNSQLSALASYVSDS